MDLAQVVLDVDCSLVVVDDALVLPDFKIISIEALTAFFNIINDDEKALEVVVGLLGEGVALEATEVMQAVEEHAAVLWDFYSKGEHLDLLSPLFSELSSSYNDKRYRVDSLVDILQKLFGVMPATYSSLNDAQEALKNCTIAFVDYYVGDVDNADEATALHVAVKDVLCSKFSYQDSLWPKLIFLISSKLPSPEGLADFRERTGIKSAFFFPVDKKDIEFEFVRKKIERCMSQYLSAVQLSSYLDSVHSAITSSANAINAELERLELHDLTALKSLRLDAESESVQSYLTWLVSEALAAKIRSAGQLQKQLIPNQSEYVPLDGKLLPKSVLFELYSEIAVAPVPEEVASGVALGDVFESIGDGGARALLLVISPACDLARCPVNYDVLCVRGVLHDTSADLSALLGKAYAFGKGKAVLKHRQDDADSVYSRITWEVKRVCTVEHSNLMNVGKYKRLARLSEIFAQEIKELALSQVSRVGTPIDPSFSVALQAFVRAKIAIAKGVVFELQFDLADSDFVSAVLAMGREPSDNPDAAESSKLEKTALFSIQFQDWILDRLMEYRETLTEPSSKIDKLVNFFGDSKNLRVVLGESGASLADGVVKVKYVDELNTSDECKSGLEIWLRPYLNV